MPVLAHLIVDAWSGQSYVDGEGGGVVVRPESVLSLWVVLHDKVHDGMTLLISTIIKLFSIHTGTCTVISSWKSSVHELTLE